MLFLSFVPHNRSSSPCPGLQCWCPGEAAPLLNTAASWQLVGREGWSNWSTPETTWPTGSSEPAARRCLFSASTTNRETSSTVSHGYFLWIKNHQYQSCMIRQIKVKLLKIIWVLFLWFLPFLSVINLLDFSAWSHQFTLSFIAGSYDKKIVMWDIGGVDSQYNFKVVWVLLEPGSLIPSYKLFLAFPFSRYFRISFFPFHHFDTTFAEIQYIHGWRMFCKDAFYSTHFASFYRQLLHFQYLKVTLGSRLELKSLNKYQLYIYVCKDDVMGPAG